MPNTSMITVMFNNDIYVVQIKPCTFKYEDYHN